MTDEKFYSMSLTAHVLQRLFPNGTSEDCTDFVRKIVRETMLVFLDVSADDRMTAREDVEL